jgi:4-hydroxy-3-polyprenylbenzoate decarboxylase
MQQRKRLIIGISGSSGIIYAVRLLEVLKDFDIETHLTISKAGRLTLDYESHLSLQDLKGMADVYHPVNDIAASIASGSFKTMGMIIAPCSMKTLAEVAHGLDSSLLSRAASVCLKERRKVALLTRESPLSLAHIDNMRKVTEMGGIICPPVPAFYNQPETIDDIVNDGVGRLLDLFEIDNDWRIRRE